MLGAQNFPLTLHIYFCCVITFILLDVAEQNESIYQKETFFSWNDSLCTEASLKDHKVLMRLNIKSLRLFFNLAVTQIFSHSATFLTIKSEIHFFHNCQRLESNTDLWIFVRRVNNGATIEGKEEVAELKSESYKWMNFMSNFCWFKTSINKMKPNFFFKWLELSTYDKRILERSDCTLRLISGWFIGWFIEFSGWFIDEVNGKSIFFVFSIHFTAKKSDWQKVFLSHLNQSKVFDIEFIQFSGKKNMDFTKKQFVDTKKLF